MRFIPLTLAFVISLLAVPMLAGCASGPEARGEPDSASTQSSISPSARYVGEVNRQARQRGVRVRWVNPPRDRDAPPVANIARESAAEDEENDH